MSRKFIVMISFVVISLSFIFYRLSFVPSPLLPVSAQSPTPTPEPLNKTWPMAGANPQRTSWVAEQVPTTNRGAFWGDLFPQWYTIIKPYVDGKIQIIAANNLLYISSAKGLYALDATVGTIAWVFPTELPLGHSPSVVNGIVYVPCMDHKIYALEAVPNISQLPTQKDANGADVKINNKIKWIFEAPVEGTNLSGSFEVNPLVVNNFVYVGNHNGYMYALDATNGTLKWKYLTGGAINFSAAYDSSSNTIYFASMDGKAYALNATTGSLIWNSPTLPGSGFISYWPVVYNNYVVFAGSTHYVWSPATISPAACYMYLENAQAVPDVPDGTLIGSFTNESWANGTMTIDASRVTNFFTSQPDHRKVFIFNKTTGTEYAPIPFLWFGTHGGTRYPPAVGNDGNLYQSAEYLRGGTTMIPQGQVVGWQIGKTSFSLPTSNPYNIDEPIAYSLGGNFMYYTRNYSEMEGAGSVDLSLPNTNTTYNNIREKSINNNYLSSANIYPGNGPNQVYGHQTMNPPIPYKGKVYVNYGGTIVAYAPDNPVEIPPQKAVGEVVSVNQAAYNVYSTDNLTSKLKVEIQKIIGAGHLRPGLHSSGMGDYASTADRNIYGLTNYFSNPADTLITLLQALPKLPDNETYPGTTKTWRQALHDYIQNEYNIYPPLTYFHIGWQTGTKREAYLTMPEQQTLMNAYPPVSGVQPNAFYALWKYAQEFGGGATLFSQAQGKLPTPPADSYLLDFPFVHNSYLAGYYGFIELGKLAGQGNSSSVTNAQTTLTRLLNLKINSFPKDAKDWSHLGYPDYDLLITLDCSRNFINLVPEIGSYLSQNANSLMTAAVNEYTTVCPYWFTTKFDQSAGEGIPQNLFDENALFQAKAYILKQSREELTKYLDVPAFERGDLFYIQNLVAAIEAPSSNTVTPTPYPCSLKTFGDTDCNNSIDIVDFNDIISHFGSSDSNADLDGSGKVNLLDLSILLRNFGKTQT